MTKKTNELNQRSTASDVAKLAGVSKWTVSRALTPGASISEKAKAKVIAAAAELGYRPNLLARSLSKKSTRVIGVAIDELKNPHSMMLLDVATRELQSRGYMALVLNITEGENYRAVIQMADQLQVDGILFVGNALGDELFDVVNGLHNVPIVQICRNNQDLREIEVVNIDGYQAGTEIAQLLLAQGYQRFGYMKGPDTVSSHLLRMDGYQCELEAAGKKLDSLLIAGHYDRKLGYQTMQHYLRTTSRHEHIEALFCENDILALGALEALRGEGLHNSIAVVGFDDIDEAASETWELTTFSQRIDILMKEAMNRLINNEVDTTGDWRKGELKIRASHIKRC